MQEVPPKLDYAPPPQAKTPDDLYAIISLVYPAVPFIGYVFKISAVYVLGGLATPVVLLIAVVGAILTYGTDRFGVWLVSIMVNGVAAVCLGYPLIRYFIW